MKNCDISLKFSWNKKCMRQSCRENQNTHFMFRKLFYENRAIYVAIWNHVVQPGRSQMTVQYGAVLAAKPGSFSIRTLLHGVYNRDISFSKSRQHAHESNCDLEDGGGCSSENLTDLYQTTLLFFPEDCCENVKV